MKKNYHKLKINSRKIFTPTVLAICGLLILLSLFAGNLVFYAFGSDDSGYAITPVLIILLLAVIGIVLCLWLRRRIVRNDPVMGRFAAERISLKSGGTVRGQRKFGFMTIRWLIMLVSFFALIYGVKWLGQGFG
ncbi:MAG: hypothetical protein CVU99_11765, partial [Firmicutes bacterium HGW-Firmicutes-4]